MTNVDFVMIGDFATVAILAALTDKITRPFTSGEEHGKALDQIEAIIEHLNARGYGTDDIQKMIGATAQAEVKFWSWRQS